jgi:hypothetical protein
MPLILLVVLIMLALGGLPSWGFHNLGYAPTGISGAVVVILVILLLTRRV